MNPNPSLTKPVIPIFLLFNPWKMWNIRITPGKAAQTQPKKQKRETCGWSARENEKNKKKKKTENRDGWLCQGWLWVTELGGGGFFSDSGLELVMLPNGLNRNMFQPFVFIDPDPPTLAFTPRKQGLFSLQNP